MRALRQMGGGLIIAVISLLLVIGGISLSLSETNSPEQPTPSPLPPIIATSIELPTLTPIPINTIESVTLTATLTSTPIASVTPLAPATVCTTPAGWIQIVVTANDTLYTIAERYKTTTEILNSSNCLNNTIPVVNSLLYVPPVPTVTVIPCGPPVGWVKNHIVQPGDNLFRIALSYGITYPQLQRANCMGSSTTIFAGQLLWVPNVPTRTPGITIVPNFPTATPSFTQQPTATFMPTDSPTPSLTTAPTNTSEPTSTFTPSFTPATPSQ
ncbi:MAG TPA: LysM peptidoglycan-binding domain-containing protein [Anaerolineales bacterium]|nr:LysM peptidoglycan-binding domain-containing protein [Anaerolineales bacterium]